MNLHRPFVSFAFALLVVPMTAWGQWAPMNPVTSVQQQEDGLEFKMQTGTLKVEVCTDSMIRVRYSATAALRNNPDYVVQKTSWPATKWSMASADNAITLTTARLTIKITRAGRSVRNDIRIRDAPDARARDAG